MKSVLEAALEKNIARQGAKLVYGEMLTAMRRAAPGEPDKHYSMIFGIATLAWPDLKIAIVRLDQRPGSAEFVRRGWRVIHAGEFMQNPRAVLK